MKRLALAAALLAAGCVNGDYNRERIYLPLGDAAIDSLRVGEDDLAAVLAQLGAPLAVVERAPGMALAWGWLDETNWNVELQIPVDRGSVQFRFDNTSSRLPGVVVFVDGEGIVERVERGVLADLLPDEARPQPLDVIEDPGNMNTEQRGG